MKRSRGVNDYCQSCEEFNAVLDGVCCQCGWHVAENRQATPDEIERVSGELQRSIDELNRFLGKTL
jgi:hypothetical protein